MRQQPLCDSASSLQSCWLKNTCSGFVLDAQVTIPVKGVEQLRRLAQRCSSSLFVTVLAAFKPAGSKSQSQILLLMHR